MKLAQLQPDFLAFVDGERGSFQPVADIAGADGVWMLCPKCWQGNGGPIGTHRVLCWAPSVPLDVSPSPGRWQLQGTGLHDLTLGPSQPNGQRSVQLIGGCNAHFYVTNGDVTDA